MTKEKVTTEDLKKVNEVGTSLIVAGCSTLIGLPLLIIGVVVLIMVLF